MPSIIDTRRDQAFPTFGADDLARLHRFGTARAYQSGEALSQTGVLSPGMFVILSGHVDATRRHGDAGRALIVTHGPGSVSGELAALSGKPALVDAIARDRV